MVTTPQDIIANATSPERAHGTTGTGFWKTIQRNRKGLSFFVSEIFDLGAIIKMSEISKYHLQEEKVFPLFWESVERIKIMIRNREVCLVDGPIGSEEIVFEGSQGLLLSENSRFFPHVTPSRTDLTNIFEMGYDLDEVYLVTRAYQTRHGAGPMTNEGIPLRVFEAEEEATKENEFQGTLRKTVLDIDLLAEGLEKVNKECKNRSIKKNLVVTCLDQIDGWHRLTCNGKLYMFEGVQNFVEFIGHQLEIDGVVFGNHSPNSKTIEPVGHLI